MKLSDYRYFGITTLATITHEHAVYYRTASGKGWQSKPAETGFEVITCESYNNYVRSIPFMNNFDGASCRAEWGYTYAGYIPVKITLVNPSGTEKHVERYKFTF